LAYLGLGVLRSTHSDLAFASVAGIVAGTNRDLFWSGLISYRKPFVELQTPAVIKVKQPPPVS